MVFDESHSYFRASDADSKEKIAYWAKQHRNADADLVHAGYKGNASFPNMLIHEDSELSYEGLKIMAIS